MYTIEYTMKAKKELKKLPKKVVETIIGKLNLLSKDPYASNNNVKKLSNQPNFRLRVSDYRIIYRLDNHKLTIIVIELGHRKEVYQ